MRFHRNAKLGLAGRRELVLAIAAGCSIRAAAASFNVSAATAHAGGSVGGRRAREERASLSCLLDRSSRPAGARAGSRRAGAAICDCRRKTGWGPRLIAGATGFAHSTVWKVLRRAASRGRRGRRGSRPTGTSGPAPATSCTWTSPATHASSGPATGHRRPLARERPRLETRVGYDYVHALVDDHSRLAYAEIHDDERAATVIGFLERALAFFASTASRPSD